MVVDFPETSVCFPNLKVLELHKVNYKDDNSAQNLISSCPALEDLFIGRGYSDNLQTLNVISRVLKNLKVTCREGFEYHVKELVIDAPALESIDFFDCVTQGYELMTDLPSTIKAKLPVSNSFSAFRDEESFETCLIELLEKICNVKFLSFSSYTMVVSQPVYNTIVYICKYIYIYIVILLVSCLVNISLPCVVSFAY